MVSKQLILGMLLSLSAAFRNMAGKSTILDEYNAIAQQVKDLRSFLGGKRTQEVCDVTDHVDHE